MRSVAKCAVSAVVVGLLALACNNSEQPPQAIVASNLQPTAGGVCNLGGEFMYVPLESPIPGPDTSDSTKVVVDGTSPYAISCTVKPNGAGYDVVAQSQITGGLDAGTFTVQGTFTPRQRDANGNPTPAGDATAITGIRVDFLSASGHLQEKDCTAQYTQVINGTPASSLPGEADTFADDKGGRIWASIFCPNLVNLTTDKSGLDGCAGAATFRFENCLNK